MHHRGLNDAEAGQFVASEMARPSSELTGSKTYQPSDLLIDCKVGLLPIANFLRVLGLYPSEAPPIRLGNYHVGGIAISAGATLADRLAIERMGEEQSVLVRNLANRAG